ncbi:MAG: hypothetical protein HUU15_09035 [Candidatus Brocadiae bacterium]|nr:hypothetical protein [Candidatus Brocadiia bacterium]
MSRASMSFACLLLLAGAARAGDPVPEGTDTEAAAALDHWKIAEEEGGEAALRAGLAKLAAVRHPMTAGKLGFLAGSLRDESIRAEAAKALGGMTGYAEAAKALHGAIKPNIPNRKALAAVFDAIGEVGHSSSVETCERWARDAVDDRDGEMAGVVDGAIGALGAMASRKSLEAVLDIWRKNRTLGDGKREGLRGRAREACRKALRRLTGEKLDSLDEWEDWWKKEKSRLGDDLQRK